MISQNAKTMVESIIAILATEADLAGLVNELNEKLKSDVAPIQQMGYGSLLAGYGTMPASQQYQAMMGSHMSHHARPIMQTEFPYSIVSPQDPFTQSYCGNSATFKRIIESGYAVRFHEFKSLVLQNSDKLKRIVAKNGHLHFPPEWNQRVAADVNIHDIRVSELVELIGIYSAVQQLVALGVISNVGKLAVMEMIGRLADSINLYIQQFEVYAENFLAQDTASNATNKSPLDVLREMIKMYTPNTKVSGFSVFYNKTSGTYVLDSQTEKRVLDNKELKGLYAANPQLLIEWIACLENRFKITGPFQPYGAFDMEMGTLFWRDYRDIGIFIDYGSVATAISTLFKPEPTLAYGTHTTTDKTSVILPGVKDCAQDFALKQEIIKLVPHRQDLPCIVWYNDLMKKFQLSDMITNRLASNTKWINYCRAGQAQAILTFFAGKSVLPELLEMYQQEVDVERLIFDMVVRELNANSFEPVYFDPFEATAIYNGCITTLKGKGEPKPDQKPSFRDMLVSAMKENTDKTSMVSYDSQTDTFQLCEPVIDMFKGDPTWVRIVGQGAGDGASTYFAFLDNHDKLWADHKDLCSSYLRTLQTGDVENWALLYKKCKTTLKRLIAIDSDSELYNEISLWVSRTMMREIHNDYRNVVLQVEGRIKTSWTPRLIMLQLLDARLVAMAESDVSVRDLYMSLVNTLFQYINK